MSTVFHYTLSATLPAIVESEALRPSNAGAPDEVPLLWFSAHQTWEPTASKKMGTLAGQYELTFQEQLEMFGCVRFGLSKLDYRLMPWHVACKAGGIGEMTRRKLERVGIKRGGIPAHWFAVEGYMPLAGLSFEVFGDAAWHAAEPAEMAQVWIEKRGEEAAASTLFRLS